MCATPPSDHSMSGESEKNSCLPGEGCGGTLLLLRTPPELLVGLDMAQWRVGKKFRGIRSIEPGCHFLHWTESSELHAPSDTTQDAECTYTRMRVDEAIGSTGQRGEFLFFKEGQIIIREWSASLGRFLPLSEDETIRYTAGVERHDFIHGLGLYPKHMRCQWRALTAHISAACVSRVEPIGHCLEAQGMPLTEQEEGYIRRQTQENATAKARVTKKASFKRTDTDEEEDEGESPSQSADKDDEAKREIRDSAEAASCRMFYMDVRPARSAAVRAAREAAAAARRSGRDAEAAAAAAAAAVTLQCTDRTDTLTQLAQENEEGWMAILGELQIAFIALVLGHHYPSLVHWKELVELLTSSERAVYLHPELFVKFIDAFYAQLEQAPDEMTQGALQEGSFLSSSCAALLETCCCVDRDAALRAMQTAPKATLGTGRREKAIANGEECADAADFGNLNDAAKRVKTMEPHYKEVEKAAARLCDLARLLFKVSRGGGELGEISPLDEVLLALQGPAAPVVVDADAELASSSCQADPAAKGHMQDQSILHVAHHE